MTDEQHQWARARIGTQLEVAGQSKWTIVDYKPHEDGVKFIVQKPGTRSYSEAFRLFPARLR